MTYTAHPDGSLHIDASRVVSKECFHAWLVSRCTASAEPEKNFQRSLTAHLTGSDGRVPFTEQEEQAILRVVRSNKPWPAFQDCDPQSAISKLGTKGFRPLGYHEKLRAMSSSSEALVNGSPSQGANRRPKRLRRKSAAAVAAAAAAAAGEDSSSPLLESATTTPSLKAAVLQTMDDDQVPSKDSEEYGTREDDEVYFQSRTAQISPLPTLPNSVGLLPGDEFAL